uniref:Uncharacterized protein n=1 Tax=Rhizophora mucronata TaxID=61149 RepID=A0A2P2IZQ8_RHIMU
MAEFLDSAPPICSRVIKFLDSARTASLFEEDPETTPS